MLGKETESQVEMGTEASVRGVDESNGQRAEEASGKTS